MLRRRYGDPADPQGDGSLSQRCIRTVSGPTKGSPLRWRQYYGWTIVAALSFTELTSYGVLAYAFAVFVVPMQEELGWSRATISGAYSLAIVVSGIAAVPVGRLLDRHGARVIMSLGSCAAAVLVFAWSRVEDLVAFYAIWVGIGMAMAMVLYEPAFAVLASWFREDRNRAMLTLTIVAGFASTVYLPLAGWLVDVRGWRDALVVLAVILAALTVAPHALVLRRRPEDLGLKPDGAQPARTSERERSLPAAVALRDALFWWLTVAFFLGTLPVAAIGVHLISYLVDLGHNPAFAATATGMLGAMSVTGRVIFTLLSRRLPQPSVTAGVFVLQAAALLLLPLWHDRLGVLVFVVLFGLGFGVVTVARASLIAGHYGARHYGTIGGVSATFVIGARAAAPAGAGAMYAASGGYGAVFTVLSVALIMAALAMVIGHSSTGSRGSSA